MAVDGNSIETRLSNYLAPATLAAHSRSLQGLNNQCLLDTSELHSNDILATPYAAWNTELGSEELSDDFCTSTAAGFECTLDSTELSTHNALVSACDQVGGTTFLQSDALSCMITDDGTVLEFQINFRYLPHCFATSCNIDEVARELDSSGEEAAQLYEVSFASLFDSVQCINSSPDPSSMAFGLNLNALLGLTSVTAVALVLCF